MYLLAKFSLIVLCKDSLFYLNIRKLLCYSMWMQKGKSHTNYICILSQKPKNTVFGDIHLLFRPPYIGITSQLKKKIIHHKMHFNIMHVFMKHSYRRYYNFQFTTSRRQKILICCLLGKSLPQNIFHHCIFFFNL